MKTFRKMAAQGDLLLVRVESIPSRAVPETASKGVFVLAHSETGHHHVIAERPGVGVFRDPLDPFRGFLSVSDLSAVLIHLRSFDTHEPIAIEPGMYEIRRQREHDAFERVRRAQD